MTLPRPRRLRGRFATPRVVTTWLNPSSIAAKSSPRLRREARTPSRWSRSATTLVFPCGSKIVEPVSSRLE